MVLWEAVIILHPTVAREQLTSTLKTFCRTLLEEGAVIRKLRNEGVMRLHRGMHAGPTDKRRLYVPAIHRWRIHEPVDDKMLFHGRYIVMLFDASVDSTLQFQELVNKNANTLEWQIRHRSKHHPLASFKDPHDFEIGHDLRNVSEEEEQLLNTHKQWNEWKDFQSSRWSNYLAQQPGGTSDITEHRASSA
eukprot:TRINITY_DN6246_c0_g1_i1.p1 TRINITY_DN6246_c0_g1~~TRINITY_DN6246_c0_g1_i1.p1  ORF type:complete len:191 (+),score=30.06 TRINITY_DN6246_c0_g1_i1:57-629(+)